LTPRTLVDVLDRARRGAPTAGLVRVDRHERESFVSWREIAARAERVAARLVSHGVERGDRVLVALGGQDGFAEAFFGAVVAGAAPAPCPPAPPFTPREEARAAIAARSSAIAARVVIDRQWMDELGQAETAPAAPPPSPPTEVAPGDLALVQFSSGTTDDPKAVALSHRAVVEQLARLDRWLPRAPRADLGVDIGVSWLPLHHDLGLVGFFLAAAFRPARLVLLPPELFAARPAAWLRAIARHRASVSAAPNFAYVATAERVDTDDLHGVDLACWRVALNGAEMVTPAALELFAHRFTPHGFERTALTPVYGLAEATLAVTMPPVGRGPRIVRSGEREFVSVGAALDGFTVSVVDEAGRELEPGQTGRVVIAGPSLFDGYWGRPAETAAVLDRGRLDTGDLGFLADGELFITGRAKDVLVVRGRQRAPEEFEEPAATTAGVVPGGAGAVMLPVRPATGRDGGEELVIFVERERASPMPDDELEKAVSDQVTRASGVRPGRVVVVGAGRLPRTTSGKVRRSALRQMSSGAPTEHPTGIAVKET
jgi:fatty-acyl-CoA synthase